MAIHRTRVIIDHEALLHNVCRVKDYAPHAHIIAMIKANAYGHGVYDICPFLAAEVDSFGVACFNEALLLRDITPNKPILLMGGVINQTFAKTEWETIFAKKFDVVLHEAWQVESLIAYAYIMDEMPCHKITVWLKIDTGMHRLGFSPEVVPAMYALLLPLVNVAIESIGFMTHFACADDMHQPMTAQQIALFQSIIMLFPAVKKMSLANSAGIMAWPKAQEDSSVYNREHYVRPGIMLYGISPFADKTAADLGLKPVMRLLSHIIAIKICKKGESVGYGAIWHAPEDRLIAVVAAGYGDGYPRHVDANAVVWVHGNYCPIVGRVSMDMLTIDITDKANISIGDTVELWGSHLSVETVARFAGTSPYELVTQITPRAHETVEFLL